MLSARTAFPGPLTLALSVLWVAPSVAAPRGDACPSGGRPFVRLSEPSGGQPLPGFEEIFRHVRAELLRKDIDVCTGGAGEPIAVVQIQASSPDSVEVVVDVRDAVTKKRVSRALDLRSLPRDARPLAIAVGTDELLVASWVEVAVHEPPEEAPPPPEAVRHVVEQEVHTAPDLRLSGAFAFETYGGGQRLLGLDVRFALGLAPRIAVTARLGLRRGLEAGSTNGTLASNAWVLGAGASFTLTKPERPVTVDAFVRGDAVTVAYLPEASGGALAHPDQATAVVAFAGLAAAFRPSKALRLALEASAGVPLRTVSATDDGSDLTSIDGAAFAAGGELGFVF